MGFGAGFGASFSRSFEEATRQSHERETDMFRYRMEDLIKRRDKYDEWKREDAKYAEDAKTITQLANQPPEAVGYVYNLLKTGIDKDKVYDIIRNGEFSFEKPDEPAPPSQPGSATPASTEQQMADIGQASAPAPTGAPAATATQTAAPAAPAPDSGGLLSQIFPGMKRPSRGERIDRRVQETLGMTADQIAEIDKGYQGPQMDTKGVTFTPKVDPNEGISDMEDAQVAADAALAAAKQNPDDPIAKARVIQTQRTLNSYQTVAMFKGNIDRMAQGNGPAIGQTDLVQTNDGFVMAKWDIQQNAWVDSSGKPIPDAQPLTPADHEELNTIAQKIIDPARKVLDSQTAFNGASRAGASMAGAVERSRGMVLNDITANTAEFIQSMSGEVSNIAQLMQPFEELDNKTLQEINPAELENQLATLNKTVASSPIGQLAKERILFKAQTKLMAYYYGMMVGQTGRALAVSEQEMFEKMAAGGTSVPSFYQNMAGIMLNQAKNIDDAANQINQDPGITWFKSRHNGMIPEIFSPVPTMDFARSDKTISKFLDKLMPYEGTASGEDTTPPAPEQPTQPQAAIPQGWKDTGRKTSDGRAIYVTPEGTEKVMKKGQ